MNAVTTTTTFCPTSLQLKFAFSGRKPQLAFVQVRLPKIDHRSVKLVSVVVRSNAVNGNGLERRTPENSSWTSLNSAADDFSGWANGDGERQSKDPKPKQSLGETDAAYFYFLDRHSIRSLIIIYYIQWESIAVVVTYLFIYLLGWYGC